MNVKVSSKWGDEDWKEQFHIIFGENVEVKVEVQHEK